MNAIRIRQRITDDVNTDFEPFHYQLETNNYYGDAFGFIWCSDNIDGTTYVTITIDDITNVYDSIKSVVLLKQWQ